MASTIAAAAPTLTVGNPAAPAVDDLGLDRAFVMSMARVPLLAVAWVLASAALFFVMPSLVPAGTKYAAPVLVICVGMVLAAVIDGYAFKVPNWLTLALVVSGWYLGILHEFGVTLDDGIGGIGSALLGTALGWALLFPALFIGGMGQGDVKMQMGFGSWVGATFGVLNGEGAWIILGAFCVGVIAGGAFGLIMMALRRQFYKNFSNFKEIITDLQVMVTMGPKVAAARANDRRKDWVRLPYGVPLCVGFLGYLAYYYYFA